MTAICIDCIHDPVLKLEVQDEGETQTCSECGEEQVGIEVEALARRIEPLVRAHFRRGEDRRVFLDPDDDSGSWEQEGDPIDWVVQEITGQYFSFQEELVAAVIRAEHCWPPDGDVPFIDDQTNYVERGPNLHAVHVEWNDMLVALKHESRFFNLEVKHFFDELFADIELLRIPTLFDSTSPSPIVEIAVTTRLHRCRYAESSSVLKTIFLDAAAQLGPPPADKAPAGRMNPQGISVLYASLEADTAFSEMRPALGALYAAVEMRPTRPLRILDFRKLDRARGGRALSHFQEDFMRQVSLSAFLTRLHELIARPIAPRNEADYVITQAMLEYLTRMGSTRLDGVLFASAQKAGGNNLAIVASSAGVFPVEVMPETLNVLAAKSVEYESRRVNAELFDGEVMVYSDSDERWW